MYSTTLGKEQVQAAIEWWRTDTISDSPWTDEKKIRETWVEDYYDVTNFLEWCHDNDRYDIHRLEPDKYDFIPIGVEAMKITMFDVLFLTGVRVMSERRPGSLVGALAVAGFVTTESTFTDEEEAEIKLDTWHSLGMLSRSYIKRKFVGEGVREVPGYTLTNKGKEYLEKIKEGKG